MFAESSEWKMPWLKRVLPNIIAIASAHPERTVSPALFLPRSPDTALGCGGITMSARRQ
jgi:hypothetical protein